MHHLDMDLQILFIDGWKEKEEEENKGEHV